MTDIGHEKSSQQTQGSPEYISLDDARKGFHYTEHKGSSIKEVRALGEGGG